MISKIKSLFPNVEIFLPGLGPVGISADGVRLLRDEATYELIVTLTQARVENRDEKNPESFLESPYVAYFGKIEAARLPLDRFFGHSGVRVKPEWLTLGQLQSERGRVAALRPRPDQLRQFARLSEPP